MNYLIKYPKLNIKKVLIVLASIILIFLIIVFWFFSQKINSEKQVLGENLGNNRKFTSTSNEAEVIVSKEYELKQYNTYTNYLFELRNEKNLNIFVSKLDLVSDRSLQNLIQADRTTYIKEFSSISNLSDIKEISINNNLANTYSFHYLDKNQNTAFYLQVVFMQINSNIYVFDFDFPLNDLSLYGNFITDFLNNFKII